MARQLDQPRADVLIAGLAARQHGVVSYQQLLDAGLGRGAIAHRVRTGLLHRVHRGVFCVGHRPVTREARWMAAVLSYGPRAALSHRSALAHWDLRPSAGRTIDITVATRNGLTMRDGVRLRRCATITGEEIAVHRAIRVTTVARTLLDGLLVETDGRETHLTRHAFERDRAKDADLTVAGYRVMRFTYRQVVHDANAVGTTLTSLLAQLRSISSIR